MYTQMLRQVWIWPYANESWFLNFEDLVFRKIGDVLNMGKNHNNNNNNAFLENKT